MIKFILFSVSIALLILGIFIFLKEESFALVSNPLIEQKLPLQEEALLPIKSNLHTYISPSQKTRNAQKEIDTPLAKNIEMYETLSIAEASLHQKPRSYVKAISAIRIHKINIQKGDTLVLPNIEGVDYEILIAYVDTNQDGSKSITGSYSDEGIPYTTTITQSSTDSFISLATAVGMYEIETLNQIGYVYKTQDIRKVMQPFPVDDAIILPSPSLSQAL